MKVDRPIRRTGSSSHLHIWSGFGGSEQIRSIRSQLEILSQRVCSRINVNRSWLVINHRSSLENTNRSKLLTHLSAEGVLLVQTTQTMLGLDIDFNKTEGEGDSIASTKYQLYAAAPKVWCRSSVCWKLQAEKEEEW